MAEHLLEIQDLDAGQITAILEEADRLHSDGPDRNALRGRIVATLFSEPSTRTRASFEIAAKRLGADVLDAQPQPGEPVQEPTLATARNLQAARADAVVVRHRNSGAARLLAQHLPETAVINAGDGVHAHPTQALLDVFTARRHLGELSGRRIVIAGDVVHSRVAASTAHAFTKLGADVILCGPPTMLPEPDAAAREGVTTETDLNQAIASADAVIALRVQTERNAGNLTPGRREYTRHWQVNDDRMALAKPHALLMHPGPMNEDVEISSAAAHGARSVIEEQVANGVLIRMAVLTRLLAPDPEATDEA